MKGLNFPITPTRKPDDNSNESYNLNSPDERKRYFANKVGNEIAALTEYFRDNTFICYMLGKKLAGKSTYTKILSEIFGKDKIRHLSVGDIVRDLDKTLADPAEKDELYKYLKANYRGYLSIDGAIEAFMAKTQDKVSVPTEFILTILKREIEKYPKTNLFIDGFPRTLDQVSYSLYFRELINYREDPDIFAMIDIPEAVINERIKNRRTCPLCSSSRNLSLLPTTRYGYDEEAKEFYLECDNPECKPVRLIAKQGDEKGIELIRNRLEADGNLIKQAANLHGIPKIYLRNAVPVEAVGKLVDEYETTKISEFELNDDGSISIKEKVWKLLDDDGVESHSLIAAAVVVAFIKQMHSILVEGKTDTE